MTLSPLSMQVAMQRRMLDRIGDPSGLDHKMFAKGAAVATATTGLLRPAGAMAQGQGKNAANTQCLGGSADQGNVLAKIITQAARFLMFLGLALMILMFAYAGFLIITAGAKKENQKKGMDAVKNAIIGGAIMLLGFVTQKLLGNFISGAAGSENVDVECLDPNA